MSLEQQIIDDDILVIKRKLMDILAHYNNKYNLNCKLEFTNNNFRGCSYNHDYNVIIVDYSDSIKFSIDKIENTRFYRKLKGNEILIWQLLHEFRHAIQQKKNKNSLEEYKLDLSRLQEEFDTDDERRYNYRFIPSEKDADDFANSEIDKWGHYR